MRGLNARFMRENDLYVSGVSEGVDFDATYQEVRRPGVAWRLMGWEPKIELYTTLEVDPETGEEYEIECEDGEWVGDIGGRVVACMVGDDALHVFDLGDLEPIADDEFCHECGQIGCTADGRE